jgi:hypothetical protein
MSEELQILNFPPDFSNHIETFNFLPVQNLDGNLMTGDLMETN